MAFVETGRGRFFYQESGSTGASVYLLHGMTAKSQDWETIPRRLVEAGYHVFAFDMRGHGQSDKPVSGYSPEDHAKDIEACAQTLGHQIFHVVGHSTGGRNALFFAVMFPKRTLSLTIIDQTLSVDLDGWKKTEESYRQYPTPFQDESSLGQFLLQKFPDKERRRKFEKGQFAKSPGGTWDWSFSVPAAVETQKLGRLKEWYDLLTRAKCPILYIRAAESPLVSVEEGDKIRRILGSSHFVTIEKAGHGVFRDNPDDFTRALTSFLQNPTYS